MLNSIITLKNRLIVFPVHGANCILLIKNLILSSCMKLILVKMVQRKPYMRYILFLKMISQTGHSAKWMITSPTQCPLMMISFNSNSLILMEHSAL
jgi:hypothetical protein